MGFWSNTFAFLGWPVGAQDGDNVRTGTITTERASDTGAANAQAATGLASTWACVSFWAGNIAGLPLTIYRPGPMGVPIEDREHPLFWLLRSPNYDQSAFDFWEYMVAAIELRGNAYAEIIKRADGAVVALSPIPPHLVTVTRQRDGSLRYVWEADGTRHDEPQEKVLHIRGFGGGPLGGVSPLDACRGTFSSALSAENAARATFSNGARPSGTLSTDKPLKPEQRLEAERLLQEKFVGAVNAGRPMLLDNGLTWQSLSITPEAAQMLESRQFSLEEICRVFEVDPHLVGHTAGNSFLGSSIANQTLSLLKFKMRKRLKRIEGALEKQLLTQSERKAGVSIEFNVEAFLRADSQGRATYYQIMKQFMTRNEIRALEGLAPVEGGDTIMVQMQDVSLTQNGTPEKAQ